MPRTALGTWMAVAALAATIGAAPALAIDLQPISPRIDVMPTNPAIDLPALRNRQLRQDFQERQDRFRQEDRNAASDRTIDTRVPVLRPSCRAVPSANRSLTICQ